MLFDSYSEVRETTQSIIKNRIKNVRVRYCAFDTIEYPKVSKSVPSYVRPIHSYMCNLFNIVTTGKVIFAGSWHGDREYWYESDIIENPTYLDAVKCANDMIIECGLIDHIYLERIKYLNTIKGVKLYTFGMGS